jgi:hypothetical protein
VGKAAAMDFATPVAKLTHTGLPRPRSKRHDREALEGMLAEDAAVSGSWRTDLVRG